MRNAQGQVLQHNLLALRATHGMDVKVTFRALPSLRREAVPAQRPGALLVIHAHETGEEYGSQTLEMYDALGSQSVLFSFQRQTGQRDAAFVEQSQLWFDALWETITTDLTLS